MNYVRPADDNPNVASSTDPSILCSTRVNMRDSRRETNGSGNRESIVCTDSLAFRWIPYPIQCRPSVTTCRRRYA